MSIWSLANFAENSVESRVFLSCDKQRHLALKKVFSEHSTQVVAQDLNPYAAA